MTITFEEGKVVTVHYPVEAPHVPVLGVKTAEDGQMYWTIDDQWLLDGDGNKISVVAKESPVPMVRVNAEDYLEISFDSGKTWTRMNSAVGTPSDGVSAIFND